MQSNVAPANSREQGNWLLSCHFLAPLVVLMLNDWFFKPTFGGWWTGKLSDITGLAILPLFLAAIAGVVFRQNPDTVLPWAVTLVTVGFVAVKTSGTINALYVDATETILTAVGVDRSVTVVMDGSDLVCLPAVLWGFWVTKRKHAA